MRVLRSISLVFALALAGCAGEECERGAGGCASVVASCGDCSANPRRPVCDQQTHACRGCTHHAECRQSGLCRYEAALPDLVGIGECYRPEQVAVVDRGRCLPGEADGSAAQPYCEVQDAVDAGRSLVAVRARQYSTPYKPLTVSRGQIIIIGPWRDAEPQAVLGGVFASGLDTSVTLVDLAIHSGTDYALRCLEGRVVVQRATIGFSKEGAYAADGCTLSIDRSRFTGNARSALRVAANARYLVTNTLFMSNGNEYTPADRELRSDVIIELGSNLGENVFTFNTIIGNQGTIHCRSGQGLKNSIVAGRRESSWFRNDNCTLTNMFIGTESSAKFDGRFALTRESQCCIDQAQPDSAVQRDHDGTLRPQGMGYDIGAYELR